MIRHQRRHEWRGQIRPLAHGQAITYRIWKCSSKFKMKANVYLWFNLLDCSGLDEFWRCDLLLRFRHFSTSGTLLSPLDNITLNPFCGGTFFLGSMSAQQMYTAFKDVFRMYFLRLTLGIHSSFVFQEHLHCNLASVKKTFSHNVFFRACIYYRRR